MAKYLLDPKFPSCRSFEPDNTEATFYIREGATFSEIHERAVEHFGKYADLEITPEYIHTHALGYDLYDPSDYTNYLKITKI